MLVLTRKADEQILIGDNIKITLVRVRGNSVRLGIEAPRDVRVVRGELEKLDAKAEADTSEPSEREEVFAHPESQKPRKPRRRPANRLAGVMANPEVSTPSTPEPQIILGRFRRTAEATPTDHASLDPAPLDPAPLDPASSERASSDRAPLADYVSAT